jgi:hypothetical protein
MLPLLPRPAVALAISIFALLPFRSARAIERHFAFLDPVITEAPGEVEMETWITRSSRPGAERSWDLRHELEIGLTPKTSLSLSLANWQYDALKRESHYRESGLELVHRFTDPISDWLGSAFSGEFAMGEKSLAFEGRLRLEKRFGPWIFAWNGVVETEYEGDHFGDCQDSSGELSHRIGVAYALNKHVSIGGEMMQQYSLGKWDRMDSPSLYAGPNIGIRFGRFSSTVAALYQTTTRAEEPTLQIRAVVGIEF